MKILISTTLFLFISILSVSGQNQQIRYDFSSDTDYRDTKERYTLSPYAMFGDSTKTLTTKHEMDKDHTLKIPQKDGLFELNMRTGLVTVKDSNGAISYTKQLTNEEKARFVTIDPLAEKYYSISPYVYCANNPIKYIDPNGEDIWIFYQNENKEWTHWVFTGNNQKDAPDNSYVNDVLLAYNYNIENGGGKKLQEAAFDRDVAIGIKYAGKGNSHYNYNPDQSPSDLHMISWDPYEGTVEDGGNGYAISPATTLDHEMDHGMRAIKDPIGFAKDLVRFTDPIYIKREEQRVIQGSEAHTAGMNGEIPYGSYRATHYGRSVRVSSPISNGRIPTIRVINGRRHSISPYFQQR